MKQNETASIINHTEHSLFLTTLVMNKQLWASLDADTQKVFADAAISAARIERAESLEDITITQKRAKEDGIQVVTLPADEVEKFKQATQEVYIKYEDYFTAGLIDSIRKQ
jgi:TRAP-type C4-dicarboxylate transport system substrate-binding protein